LKFTQIKVKSQNIQTHGLQTLIAHKTIKDGRY